MPAGGGLLRNAQSRAADSPSRISQRSLLPHHPCFTEVSGFVVRPMPRHEKARRQCDQNARAAHPAQTAAPAMPPPQSRAADSHHDEYERDEDDSGDAQEPLLPRFRFATASEGNKARRRRRWAERAALLASGALVVVGLVTVSAWMLSGGQRAGLAAAQVAPPSDGPASLATSSPPSRPSFAQQFLHNASFVNEGVVPFPSSLYSPVYRPRPLEHTLTTSSFASSPRCLERYIATGEVCSSFNGRWADEATRPKVDAIWTWVNGSSAELLTRWREAAAAEETRGRGRRLRRWLGRKVGALRRRLGEAAVARHFRFVPVPSARESVTLRPHTH